MTFLISRRVSAISPFACSILLTILIMMLSRSRSHDDGTSLLLPPAHRLWYPQNARCLRISKQPRPHIRRRPRHPDLLIGDSLRLRQVITNLVGNAIKFTPSKVTRKDHVVLSCRLVSVEDLTVKLEFCVMDTGNAIAKDKLNLIFDTFCQADGSTTRVNDSFSLLSILSTNDI